MCALAAERKDIISCFLLTFVFHLLEVVGQVVQVQLVISSLQPWFAPLKAWYRLDCVSVYLQAVNVMV